MEKLNLKYGLDPSNREQPKGDDGVKWSKEVNDWLSKTVIGNIKKNTTKHLQIFLQIL